MPTNRLVVKEEVSTYAAVLLDGLYEAGGQDAALEGREQLKVVSDFMRTSIDLSDAMADPGFGPEQRKALMKNTFSGLGYHPVLVEVLAVMGERGDIALLPRVWSDYGEQIEAKLGITVIDVTTSIALDDNLRQVISKKTSADFGTDVVLVEHVDPAILGGIIMSAHGKRIDASVQSQLESARNVLKLSTDGGES